MKRILQTLCLITIFLLGSLNISFSQFNTGTITLNGTTTGETAYITSGAYSMAWDNTYLYIRYSGGGATEPVIFHIDVDPQNPVDGGSNSNGSLTGPANWGITPTLPFRSDFTIYWESQYAEYRTDNGSGGWSGTTEITTTDRSNTGTAEREIRLAWTWMGLGGRPTSFNWTAFANSRATPGFIFNQTPSENPGGASSAPTLNYYWTVSSTANDAGITNPFDRKSFESRSNLTLSTANTFWDFTTNGGTLTNTANHTINNQFYVVSGTFTQTGARTLTFGSTGTNTPSLRCDGTINPNNGAGNDLNCTFAFGTTTISGTASDANFRLFNITVNDGATLQGPASGTVSLGLQFGTMTVNGSGGMINFRNGTGVVNVNVVNSGTNNYNFNNTSGTATLNNLTISTGATFRPSSTGTHNIRIGGNLINTSGTYSTTNSTGVLHTTFNGSSAQTTSTAATFQNLTVSGSGGLTIGGNTTVNGALTVNAGSSLNLSTFTMGSPTSTTLEIGTTGSTISGSGIFTLGGNISVNNTGGSSGATISCPVALGANRTFTISDGTPVNDLTINGVISGASFGLIKSGAGTLTLAGANSYTGNTTINAGTLTLGANNALPISSSAGLIQFAAGTPTFNLGLFNLGTSTASANSAGALDFDVNTTVNLGSSGTNTYYFKASNDQTWNATTITINNWTGTAGLSGTGPRIFIGSDVNGLTSTQLAKITFNGYSGTATILSTGEVVPAAANMPTISSFTSNNPNATQNGYTGSTITITGTNFTGATAVSFGGTAAASFNVDNATTITAVVAAGTSGNVSVTTPNGTASLAGFTYLGYISNAATDWNTGTTWLGGNTPPAGATVTIDHAVTVNSSVTNNPANVTINASRSLTFGASGALTVNTNLTNNGSVVMTSGGTLTMASGATLANGTATFTGGAGTVVFSAAGTITGTIAFNNLTLNGALTNDNPTTVTVNGNLQLNSGATLSNAPIYGSSSTLIYNNTGSIGQGNAWTGTTTTVGAGTPQNITIQNGTTVTLTANRGLAGNLNLGSTGTAGSLSLGTINSAVLVGGNVTIGSDAGTSTLTLSTTSGGDIKVGGNWTRTANGTFTHSTRAVFFTGSGTNIINSTGGATFDYLVSEKTGGSIQLASNLTATASGTGNALALVSAASFDLNGNTLNLTNATASNIQVSNGVVNFIGTGTINISGAEKTITSASSGTVSFGSGITIALANVFNPGSSLTTINGTLQINSGGSVNTNGFTLGNSGVITGNTTNSIPGTVIFSGAGTVNGSATTTFNNLTLNGAATLTTAPTISGTLTMNAGSSVATNSPTYGASSTLVYATAMTEGLEWPSASGPQNVTLNASIGTVTLSNNVQVNGGLLTINTGSTLDVSTSNFGITLAASANFANSGTFTARNGTVTFSGAGTVSGSSTTTFSTVILNGALTGSFSVATSGTVTMNSTASVSGTVTTVGAATFNGTAGASTFSNLTLNGAATLTKVTQVNGTLQFNAGASVSQTQTYGGSAVLLYNGTSFTTTNNEWPTSSGPQNVTITAGASNVVTLNSNKTIAGTLTLNTGSIDLNATTLTLNSGSAAQTISGSGSNSFTINSTGNGIISLTGSGSHTITVSNFGTSSSSGLIFGANVTLQMNSNAILNCGGNGTSTSMVTIAGTLQLNSTNNSNIASNTAPFYTSSSTLEYRVGYGAFQEWLSGTALSTPGVPQNVVINASGSSVTIPGNRSVLGNFTIVDGTFSLNGTNTLSVRGNWLRQNSSTSVFTPSTGTVVFNGASAQTIQVTGGGTNTATFYGLTINNTTGGVSLNSPVNVTNLLTLTSGIVTTTSSNVLTITATTTGSISGGSASTHISGPLVRTLPSSTSGTATYVFPLGKSGSYLPLSIVNPTTGTGTVTVTSEGFAADPAGTPDFSTVYAISTTEYWSYSTTGNFTNSLLSLTRSLAVSPLNLIASSTTSNGTYSVIGTSGTPSSGTVTTTGTVSGGSEKFVTFAQSTPTGPYTVADGDWNTNTIWRNPDNTIPAAGTAVTILNQVTVNSAVTNAPNSIQISSGRSLTIGASGAITTTTLTNGGTLAWSGAGTLTIANTGTLTNNVTFTRGTGNVVFAGSGTIAGTLTMNNLTVNGVVSLGNAVTVDGTLQINSGGGISTNAPIYTANSTLSYNTTSNPYNVSTEWTGNSTTAGSGVPQNVTIAGSNNVTLPTSDRGMAGSLSINNGTFSLNATSGNFFIAGNFTVGSSGTFTHNSRTVTFNGSGTQILTRNAGGTQAIGFLTVAGSGTLQLGTNTDLQISGASGLTLSSSNATSTINLNGRSLLLNGGGNVSLSSGNRRITSSSAATITVSGSNLAVTNGGTLTIGDNVVLATSVGINFNGITTIGGGTSGTFRINTGGFANTNAPIYAVGSTLHYNSGDTYGRGLEWSATSGAGYPHNVQIGNGTTLNLGNNGAATARQCAGNLSVEGTLSMNITPMTAALTVLGNVTNTGTLTLSSSIGGDLRVHGNLLDNGTFNANNRAVFFNGGNVQDVSGSGTFDISYVRIGKSGGRVRLLSNLTCTGPNGGNAMEIDNGSSQTSILDLNGFTLFLGQAGVNSTYNSGISTPGTIRGNGGSISILGNGALGTLNFDQSTPGTTNALVNLTIDRQSTGSVTLGNDLVITNNLTLTNGNFTVKGSPTLSLNGNNVAGTASNLDVDNTSRLSFGGSTSGITIPTHITTLHTLNIANTSTNGVATNITGNTLNIASALTVESNATLNPAAADIISGGGTLSGTGTVRVTRTAATADFSTQYPISGKTLTDLTVNYFNSTGSQTISALTYGKLTQSNTSGMNTLGGNVVTNELTLASGGTLNIGSGNSLTINSSLSGTGLIRGSNTSDLSIGSSFGSSTFYFDQTSTYGRTISSLTNVLRNFSIAGGTVILGNPLNLANGVFSMSGGTIQLGNNDITLKSDNTASTMAQVGSLTNGIISYNGSGRFIAERAMTTARRGFRNLSSGGILSDADIWTNWQEGATTENYIPNFYYGMQITGGNYTGSSNAVDPVTGFDATRTGSPSLWTYGLANTYVPVTSTKGTILYPFVGYYAIVRGNRYYDLFSGGPALNEATSTTLRVKGKLLRGNVTLNTTNSAYTDPATNESVTGPATLFPGSNRYSLVGNPYASAINWASVYGASTNIRSAYYVWQQNIGSNTGGWATCDNLGLTTGGGNLNVFIQPGQSFFVKNVNVSGASPTISFTESVKAAANGNLTTTFDLGSPIHQIRFVLKKEVEGSLAGIDDALVAFREDFNNELNSDDVDKFPNTTENIFLFPNRRSTAIEKRALPTNKDTVVLRMTNLVVGTQYNIAVAAQQFTHNMDAFVWDRLTNTTTAVKKSDTTFISFTPTADTNTYFSRYYLVFRNPVPLSNGVSNLQGRQVGNNNAISWQATGEQTAGIVEYVVEKSANGQSFIVLATLTAKGGNNINQYQYIDENAAASNAYYRVRIVSGIETGKFTNTVQLKAANSKKQVSIYPTLITNQQFQLQLTGYEKGTYTVRVFNTIGQDIWTQKLQHEGGNSNYTIRMTETNLSSGTYFVHLYQNNGAVITQKIQIP